MAKPKAADWPGFQKIAKFRQEYPDFPLGRSFGGVYIEAGRSYPDHDGPRLVLDVSAHIIWFIQKGKLYTHTTTDFLEDLRMYGPIEGGIRAKGMVHLYELEMKFFMAFAGASSLALFIATLGVDMGRLAVENRELIKTLPGKLKRILRVRRIFKKYAPTLYDLLFSKLIKQVWSEVKGNMFDLDSWTAEDVVVLVATLAGKTGGLKKLAGTLSIVWTVISSALSIVLTTVKVAAKGKVAELKDPAELIAMLRRYGITVSRDLVPAIRKDLIELAKHQDELIAELRKAMPEVVAAQRAA